jgi:hypothetical protein
LQYPLFLSYDKLVRKILFLLLIGLPLFFLAIIAIPKHIFAADVSTSPTTPVTCSVCKTGEQYSYYTEKCLNNSTGQYSDPTTQTCTTDQQCSNGFGCLKPGAQPSPNQPLSVCGDGKSCPTAIGPLPTDRPSLLTKVFGIVLSIAGIAALALIIASGYRLMVSQGNPEQVKGAREQLTAAIVGLLFIIFSFVLLQVIGVSILAIPGFK